MPTSPFTYLVTIRTWPSPAGVRKKYHYFRKKKTALWFVEKSPFPCDLVALIHGATLLKPVALATLEYGGELYDCRREFPYETLPKQVSEAWQTHDILGCDCGRSDLISMNCQSGFPHLPHGSLIKLHHSTTLWESESDEFELH